MQTGRKISFLRENAGLTQEQLAGKAFVSRELVSKWETGKSRPDRKMISLLAGVLKVPEREIMDVNESLTEELSSCFPEGAELPAADVAALLNSFLKTLTPFERDVFISRYYYGSSSRETARELGLREGNVRKRLMLIRNRFSDYIKEKYDG